MKHFHFSGYFLPVPELWKASSQQSATSVQLSIGVQGSFCVQQTTKTTHLRIRVRPVCVMPDAQRRGADKGQVIKWLATEQISWNTARPLSYIYIHAQALTREYCRPSAGLDLKAVSVLNLEKLGICQETCFPILLLRFLKVKLKRADLMFLSLLHICQCMFVCKHKKV